MIIIINKKGGVDVTVTDVDKKPDTSFWGVVKKFVPGIGDVSIRADMDADAPETVDFDVRTNTFGTSLVLKGQAGKWCGGGEKATVFFSPPLYTEYIF